MIIVIIYTSECAPLTSSSIFNNFIISSNLIVSTNPAEVYNFVIKNKSWPVVQRFKKHRALDSFNFTNNPSSNDKGFFKFGKNWSGKSGIYKITFLPYRLFTYIGSSKDLGARFKYHYYMTSKLDTFLGYFIKVFGWEHFSITVLEKVPVDF